MWSSRTKYDLIIEVWEKLDCESVGRHEIESIEIVVEDHYGSSAVDPPMVVARILADEGADLRHAEIMELHVERASYKPYAAAFQNILNLSDLRSTAGTIKRFENLRRKYHSEGDKRGVRLVREAAIKARQKVSGAATDEAASRVNAEIAEWLAVWLQTPELFEAWLDLRVHSAEFLNRFGPFDQ